ncbi:MotE family protein [Thiovibrio sp. JS02]
MRIPRSKICIQGAIVLAVLFAALPAATEKKPVEASSQEIALTATLREREEAVAVKEKELADKEGNLAALSREVDEKYAKLIALQEEVKAQLAELKKVQDQRFKNLIKIYSSMSASKVAPLLDKMDDDEVVEILKAMKTDEVAKIIPKLDPEKAVRVSRSLGML